MHLRVKKEVAKASFGEMNAPATYSNMNCRRNSFTVYQQICRKKIYLVQIAFI
jgi:hypothetical protein